MRRRFRFLSMVFPWAALCALLAPPGALPPVATATAGTHAAAADRALSALDAAVAAHARALDATLRAATPAPAPARVKHGEDRRDGGGRPQHSLALHRPAPRTAPAAVHTPANARPAGDAHEQRRRALPFFHSAAPPPHA